MNGFILYLIGVFMSLVILIFSERQDRDVTLKLLFLIIFYSLYSWFAVVLHIFSLIHEKGDKIVIFKKTKPKKETYYDKKNCYNP